MCTVVTKMYKENGTVHYSSATRWVELQKDTDSGLSLYPIAHYLWEEKEGSARGEGEVKTLIPNQLETNKNFMRSVVVAKNTAYPQKVIRTDKVVNPSSINEVGGTILFRQKDFEKANKNSQEPQVQNDQKGNDKEAHSPIHSLLKDNNPRKTRRTNQLP